MKSTVLKIATNLNNHPNKLIKLVSCIFVIALIVGCNTTESENNTFEDHFANKTWYYPNPSNLSSGYNKWEVGSISNGSGNIIWKALEYPCNSSQTVIAQYNIEFDVEGDSITFTSNQDSWSGEVENYSSSEIHIDYNERGDFYLWNSCSDFPD